MRLSMKNVPGQVLSQFFHLHRFSLLFLSLVIATGNASAQSTYGTLQGTVTDSAGAVVAGASVVATNEATGSQRNAKSDGAGDYRLENLDPGSYTVEVSSPNFASTKDEHVTLPSRETIRADFKLAVKSAAQEVVVTANQEIINEDLTQSNSLSGEEISSLPLNFRATNNPSPIGTAILTPTVEEDSGGNLTFAGQVPTATSFSLDGISVQQTRYGGPTKDLFPSVEGIDEFRVNTAGGDAEYAQPTDLTVTTRSGTNRFHGSGYWFAQRASWNSDDLIAGEPVSLNANTYGASLSGPIWRDKTFFYFDYEGVRLQDNQILNSQTVPAAWLNGDFSGETAAGLQLYNPATGQPLPSNNLAALGLTVNPIAKIAFQNFFPTPVGPSASDDALDVSGANNLHQIFPGQYTSDVYDGRIDHLFNEHHHIFGRVTKKNITATGTESPGGTGDADYNPLMGTFNTGSDLTNVVFSYNWIINSHLLNEARGGWSFENFSYTYPQAAQGDSIIASMESAGLQAPAGITLGHPVNGLGGVSDFYVGNLLGGDGGDGTNEFGHPRLNNNTVVEFGDIFTYSKGPLDVKVGGSFRRVSYRDNITFLDGDEYGDYFNEGVIPCGSAQAANFPDACSVAELWLGLQDGTSLAQNGPDGKPYSHHFDGFGQFDWKAKPNLTVNLGIRYELNTPFIDETNQLGQFDTQIPKGELIVNRNEKISAAWAEEVGDIPSTTGGLPTVGTATGIPGIPFTYASSVGLGPGLRYLDTANIQPRVGAIWKPFPHSETVVKASAGLYSVPVLGAVLYSLLGVDTSNFGSYNAGPYATVFAGTGSAGAFPGYRRANQWDLKDPSVGQWNFSVEQNVGFKTDVKLSYTGSHSWNLIYSPDLNQVAPNTTGYNNLVATPALRLQNLKFPNFREVLTRANGPWDNYNSFSIEANRRFASGLSFTNAFTLTSNNTNALGTAPNSAIAQGGQGDNGGNVNNAFDIRSDYGHAFYDPRFKFLSTAVFNLPVGRGQMLMGNASPLVDRIVGGWSMTAINLYHSGNFLTPYFPSGDYDPSGTAPHNRSVSEIRPDVAAGVSTSPTQAQKAAGLHFNPLAFEFPGSTPGGPVPSAPIGRFGNAGVGILTGPQTETFSTSIGKNLPIAEHFVLRYECQVSNLFNFVNANNPALNITSPNSFGLYTSSQAQAQAGPRTIQMSLRLSY